jgi:HEAT repeat protein
MLRWTRFALVGLLAALLAVALLGCDGGTKEPEEVVKARELLEELWKTGGPNGKALMVACCEHVPGLGYCESKIDEALDTNSAPRLVDFLKRYAVWDDPSMKDRVEPLLDHESELVRVQAAKMLASWGDDAGLEILEKHIRSAEDAPVNPEICGLAAQLGSEKCLVEAGNDLTSDDEEKSAAAAAALAEIGGANAAQILRQALGQLHGEKRGPAIEALGEVSEDPADVDRVLEYFGYRENVIPVIHALGALGGETAEKRLREVLDTDDALSKTEAAGALARMDVMDEQVVSVFEEAIAAESDRIRFLAAEGLGQAPDTSARAAELLAQLVGDDDLRVVRKALEGLKDKATQEQIAELEQAWNRLEDATEDAGYQESMDLLVVVSRVPGEKASAILQQALDNQNWGRVVQAAMGILERHQSAQPEAEAA